MTAFDREEMVEMMDHITFYMERTITNYELEESEDLHDEDLDQIDRALKWIRGMGCWCKACVAASCAPTPPIGLPLVHLSRPQQWVPSSFEVTSGTCSTSTRLARSMVR